MPLTIVGHLGLDIFRVDDNETRFLGGSLFHFLNGYALSGAECEVFTWTTGDVMARVRDRLPSRIQLSVLPVKQSPEFEIQYQGEELISFVISNLEMPAEFPSLISDAARMHFCAMPVSDILAVLHHGKPQTWSLQLHESVLPSREEFAALPSAPTHVFCNALEYESCPPETRLSALTEWVVTERDRIRVFREEQLLTTFQFQPLERVSDPTGAGDFFAGAVVGALERQVPTDYAVRFGTGAAAIGLSGWSSEPFSNWWS